MQRRQGTTLAELMIVITIIGILSAMMLSRLDFSVFRLDAGVREIEAELQLAQRLALRRQRDVMVSVDATDNRLRLVQDDNDNGAIDAGEKSNWHALEDGVQMAAPPLGLFGGTNSVPVTGSLLKSVTNLPTVIFRRDGAASSDLFIYLTTTGVHGGRNYRAVHVVKATGRADWYRYVNGAWVEGDL
jgi:prepilin-type N-terminal cleavage/methylation domain-containing protein